MVPKMPPKEQEEVCVDTEEKGEGVEEVCVDIDEERKSQEACRSAKNARCDVLDVLR